jgi:glycosyltransferase involved in cell wall biosynthesis
MSISRTARPLRVCFCWSDISGYMAACWRALAQDPDILLHVFAYSVSRQTAFSHELMDGVDWTPLDDSSRKDERGIARAIAGHRPDVVVLAGWLSRAYRALPKRRELSSVRFVMGMDTPWRATIRQSAARYVLRSYLAGVSSIVVAGERSWQYAQRLGFSESRIHRGLYGVDFDTLSAVYMAREATAWPRAFLFAGRYTAEKGVDILRDAYRQYRHAVEEPWPLVCCGKGEMSAMLTGQDGIEEKGFVQPSAVRQLMQESAVFILPSRFDPWPLALVEACASGLPVIASNACGSAVECVRDRYNGRLVAIGNSRALADAMIWIHRAHADLPLMGLRSLRLAEAYSAAAWLNRWKAILCELVDEPETVPA